MAGFFKISQRASIALHALTILANSQGRVRSSKDMALFLNESEAHMSKVLQRLGKAGFVGAMRGPNGGFFLKRPAKDISLLNIYEAMEGPVKETKCLLDRKVCASDCMFGDLVIRVDREVKKYMSEKTLNQCGIIM